MSIHIERLVVGSMATNCYLMVDTQTHQALIIDPGDDAEYIIDKLTQMRAKPIMIIATHGHFDHIMGARALQLAYAVPFSIHADDMFLLKRMQESARHFLGITVDPPPEITKQLEDKDVLNLGETSLEVIYVPGHTPGSICLSLESEKLLFVGDTIFVDGAIGRSDFSYSSKKDLDNSIKKILSHPQATRLLPGHGEETVIEREQLFHKVQ